MHGLGNDFVILDTRAQNVDISEQLIRSLADRHRGVGCDQIAILFPSAKGDIQVRYFNGDGSESGACGNATRCVADIIMSETGKSSCSIELTYGVLHCIKESTGLITVDMGQPYLNWKDIPLSADVDTLHLPLVYEDLPAPVAVGMGNPHCVFFINDLNKLKQSMEEIGKTVEYHPLFPQRTNVEFVEIISKSLVRQKTWERGAGFTLACGSGACAVAVAGVRRGLTDRKIEIQLDGGSLFIEWREVDNHILMTGPVTYVYEGFWLGKLKQ